MAGEIRLLQRGDEFSINLDGGVLMNSRMRVSEEALARLGCARAAARPKARVLIGGLGMGFTLRAALAELSADAEVIVAELIPAVVAWAHGPLDAIFGNSLADPRVSIVEGDVSRLIRSKPAAYDAILLDVDNGPDALTHDGNEGLYTVTGLRAARAALRPGGILGVWSARPDAAFNKRLATSGFAVKDVAVHAHGKRGARHTIWIGTRDASTG